ncbi:class I SAM-dependent methyltransferase [Pseudomonadota bacterium]
MKLDYLDLEHHELKFRNALRERLADLEFIERGKSALCLGARLGAEVRAFIDLGLFAVGVDLNPGQANSYVLHGDFQHLQQADDSVDVVYTNSIDHAFDIEGMVREILRVVKSDGYIIIEPDPGVEDTGGIEPDLWATQSWKSIDGLMNALEGFGLSLVKRRPFEYPRGGQQLIFVPLDQSGE